MIRLGSPDNLEKYKYTDDGDIIFRVHQLGIHPDWKDMDGTVYFKITNKLIKTLAKHGIEF